MNVLVLNGSPMGENSNSYYLAKTFLEGMGNGNTFNAEVISVYKLKIKPCIGCYTCWTATPGECCIKDDMAEIIQKMIKADIIVWSFPLYFYNLPSQLKALMDRQLPLLLPFMAPPKDNRADGGFHIFRYDLSKQKHIVVSTCGFYTTEFNYDCINVLFERCYGKDKYETIFCAQGGLLKGAQELECVSSFLSATKKAGEEYMQGGITSTTREKLTKVLLDRKEYEKSADLSWSQR